MNQNCLQCGQSNPASASSCPACGMNLEGQIYQSPSYSSTWIDGLRVGATVGAGYGFVMAAWTTFFGAAITKSLAQSSEGTHFGLGVTAIAAGYGFLQAFFWLVAIGVTCGATNAFYDSKKASGTGAVVGLIWALAFSHFTLSFDTLVIAPLLGAIGGSVCATYERRRQGLQ